MTAIFSALASLLSFGLRSRTSLELELVALRHQVAVLRRQRKGRLRLFFADRLLWVWLFTYIALSKEGKGNIGLWSGGKRPILIPSLDGYMIDLAAILPFLYTIFFGLKKVPQAGGDAFEESVRAGLRVRGLDICLQGELRWSEGTPREDSRGSDWGHAGRN